MAEQRFAIGAFVLDRQRGLLLKDGAPVPLGHRGLALLGALARAGGRVVSKAELMDVAWPHQEVEESNLSVQIATLRKLLGDRPDGQEWITTVPRVGYQLCTAESSPTGDLGLDARRPPRGRRLPSSPSSISRTAGSMEFFADGMTDDIISALSRVGELSVVSRSSSYTLKGRALPAREAAAELGVRYILEGSLRASAERMRVTAQLTDGHTGKAIWAERYDGTADALFAFQDDLTRSIVQALQVTLTKGEAARLWEGQTRNLRAWEKAVLGHQSFLRYTTADNAAGRRLLEEAVAIDPRYTGALAWLGVTHYWDARYSPLDRAGRRHRPAATLRGCHGSNRSRTVAALHAQVLRRFPAAPARRGAAMGRGGDGARARQLPCTWFSRHVPDLCWRHRWGARVRHAGDAAQPPARSISALLSRSHPHVAGGLRQGPRPSAREPAATRPRAVCGLPRRRNPLAPRRTG